MNIRKPRAALLLALVVVGTGACAGGGTTPASTPGTSSSATVTSAGPERSAAATPTAAAITIRDFSYQSPVSVSPGATVTVTNMDSAGHTVTADQGAAFDVDVKGSGGTATFTAPSAPGTYAYHCTYHPNMHGTLTVR